MKSKVIPVIGKYITAAADVGLMLVGIVQVGPGDSNLPELECIADDTW